MLTLILGAGNRTIIIHNVICKHLKKYFNISLASKLLFWLYTHRISFSKDLIKKFNSNLNINKNLGVDKLPPIFLVNCAKSISIPLAVLFIGSMRERVFPENGKDHIVPIHKKGSKCTIQNYRPISIPNPVQKCCNNSFFI